jgi:hypothetical protein
MLANALTGEGHYPTTQKALREKLFTISSFEQSISRGMSLVGVIKRVGLLVPSDDVGGKYKHFSFAHD